jgi:hypothetical protein
LLNLHTHCKILFSILDTNKRHCLVWLLGVKIFRFFKILLSLQTAHTQTDCSYNSTHNTHQTLTDEHSYYCKACNLKEFICWILVTYHVSLSQIMQFI